MSNLKRNPDILWRLSGDDVLLFSLDSGSLWRINGTGAKIWNLLDGKHSLAEISQTIHDEYREIDEERIINGLDDFVTGLRERDMIQE